MIGEERLYRAPLVKAEVVDEYEEYFVAGVEERKHFARYDVWTHEWSVRCFGVEERTIVAAHPFEKFAVGLALLVFKEFEHGIVGSGEFHLAVYKSVV